jgi:hypothetical protein
VQPGQTIGLILNEDDRGPAMICVEARESDNGLESSGCGMFGIKPRKIVQDELTLVRTPN